MDKEKKKKRGILAEGEVTGHAHVVAAEVTTREDGVKEFSLPQADVVEHEEHGPVQLAGNKYLSDQVVEYNYDKEEARRVQD